MSQAFVREGEDQWLEDISPTHQALLLFLTRENGGIAVYEKKKSVDEKGNEVFAMSNGLSYTRNEKGRWQVV